MDWNVYRAFCVRALRRIFCFRPPEAAPRRGERNRHTSSWTAALFSCSVTTRNNRIENPRRERLRYPKVYSPRHPLFSRAMLNRGMRPRTFMYREPLAWSAIARVT